MQRITPAGRRPGFTLIELLVVVSILTIQIGLTTAGVQKARVGAYRIKCANHLRQLGLAAHLYEQDFSSLPPAIQMKYARRGQFTLDSDPRNPAYGPNWAVLLLPYFEQGNLYSSANVAGYCQTGDQGWRRVRNTRIPILLCPADVNNQKPFEENGTAWARGNYACNAGPTWWPNTMDGLSAQEWFGSASGVMCINWGATITLLSNQDGSSRTLLFTEVRAGLDASDRRGVWAMGFPGSSVTAANAIGDCTHPNDFNAGSDDVMGCHDRPDLGMGCWLGCGSWQAQARSMHPGGVNACFADGSVQFISNNIDQLIWACLNSRDDGNSVSP
jgi:prepilin-type N-terminal cleavage/methylation domain-containing protein/prepilin-type processing-associated H-X9-DG protein